MSRALHAVVLVAVLAACSSKPAPSSAPNETDGGVQNSLATPVAKVPAPVPAGCTEATYQVVALATCTTACEQGVAESCALAGRMLGFSARRVRPDHARALTLLERGCELGEGQACADLAGVHSPRKTSTGATVGWPDVPHDAALEASYRERAVAALQRECTAGRAMACSALGGAYEYGMGVARDTAHGEELAARAIALQRTACDADDGWACAELARLYYLGRPSVPIDRPRWRELNTKACALAYAPACHEAAGSYEVGDGGAKDKAKAIELWQRGCDLGHHWGCASVARMKNDLALYVKACEMGNGFACSQAADKLHSTDAAQATRLLETCCDREDTDCCRQLGRMRADADAGPR